MIGRLLARIRGIATTRIRILGQQGSTAFLVDVGDGRNDRDLPLARVYDRTAHRLFDPFPRDSIVARGYWEDPSVDDADQAAIRDEVRGLL